MLGVGCVSGTVGGETQVSEGYATFREAGVAFAHPEGWRVDRQPASDGGTRLVISAPDPDATPAAGITLSVLSDSSLPQPTSGRGVPSVAMRMAMVLVGLGVALLAGCGGDSAREDSGEDRAGDDAPPLAGPLVYERSGGLAGDKSQITLRPDGRATFATERLALQPGGRGQYSPERIGERTAKLAPVELEEVERALARVDLAKLPARIVGAEPIPDAFGHSVAYQGESVFSDDQSAPDELRALTARLSALFDRYAPEPQRQR